MSNANKIAAIAERRLGRTLVVYTLLEFANGVLVQAGIGGALVGALFIMQAAPLFFVPASAER